MLTAGADNGTFLNTAKAGSQERPAFGTTPPTPRREREGFSTHPAGSLPRRAAAFDALRWGGVGRHRPCNSGPRIPALPAPGTPPHDELEPALRILAIERT